MKLRFWQIFFSISTLILLFLGGTQPVFAACEVASSSLASSPNLVSYWRYESNANDTQGLNNGTDVNVSYNTGKFGQAGIFNGTAYSYNSTSSFIFGAGARSVSTWFWLNSTGEQMLFKYGTRTGNAHAYLLEGYNPGAGWKLYFNSGGAGGDETGSSAVSTGGWHNVIANYDGTTNTLYLDGVQDAAAALALDTQNVLLNYRGAEGDVPTAYLDGKLDDTAIFNRTLTPTEIAEINGTCNPPTPPTSTIPTSTWFLYFWDNYNQPLYEIGALFLLFGLIIGIVKVMREWRAWTNNNL